MKPDPDNVEALLGLSVELVNTMNAAKQAVDMEAAMARHPSSQPASSGGVLLTAADRCDECPAAAAYRLALKGKPHMVLDFCNHHLRKHFPGMIEWGWVVIGGNPDDIQGD